jgi:hypothetical protein
MHYFHPRDTEGADAGPDTWGEAIVAGILNPSQNLPPRCKKD